MTHRNIYNIPTSLEGDNEEDDQEIIDVVYKEHEYVKGNAFVEEANDEDSTLLHRDNIEPIELNAEPIQLDASIVVDEVYMQFDGSMFIDDSLFNGEHDTNFNDEEKLSINDDTNSKHEEESSRNNDTDSNDDMC
ncbi:hypothetical protein SLA2020_265530 [Shorea laevis]